MDVGDRLVQSVIRPVTREVTMPVEGKSDFSWSSYWKTQWYGIEINEANTSPDVTRIASTMDEVNGKRIHAELPVHSQIKGCLLLDNGTVNYYLDPTDWSKKADGTASNLTGADGQVMIEWPDFYYKVDMNGGGAGKHQIKISMGALTGFTKVPKHYISAYEAAMDRVNSKLSSVKSTDAQYRGGDNNDALDEAVNSLLGKPATSINRTNFRTYAQNRGSGWNQYGYNDHKWLFWFFAIEYATLNSQKAVNAVLTVDGYKQGGLGDGVSDANGAEWSNFSSNYPFISCGASDSLASGSGEVNVTVTDFGGTDTDRTFTVNRYRGHEMPFGHIWKICDGINIRIFADKVAGVYNAPPASPTNGMRVIVGADPSGDFAGKAHNIAVYSTSTTLWTFTAWAAAWADWVVYSDADEKYYINADGSGFLETTDTYAQISEVYTVDDASKWQDSNYNDYTNRGLMHRASGYMNKALLGAGAEFVPAQAGISGTGMGTYYCDYFYTSFPTAGDSLRMLLVGGAAANSAYDGFAFSYTNYGPSSATAFIGSRLRYQ